MYAAETLTICKRRKQLSTSSVTTHETLQRQSGAAKTAEHPGTCGGRKAVSVSANDGRGTEAEFKKTQYKSGISKLDKNSRGEILGRLGSSEEVRMVLFFFKKQQHDISQEQSFFYW